MYFRLTFNNCLPDKIEEAKEIYFNDIAPVIKQQSGNIDVKLLLSVDTPEESITFSTWETQGHASEYEASGLYKELVDKARHTFAKPPVLKTYEILDQAK